MARRASRIKLIQASELSFFAFFVSSNKPLNRTEAQETDLYKNVPFMFKIGRLTIFPRRVTSTTAEEQETNPQNPVKIVRVKQLSP